MKSHGEQQSGRKALQLRKFFKFFAEGINVKTSLEIKLFNFSSHKHFPDHNLVTDPDRNTLNP